MWFRINDADKGDQMYSDFDWYHEMDDRETRWATDAEAHVEWHLNSGVPMGTPGCPQDACHADEYEEEE